jgi:hypothetical protein
MLLAQSFHRAVWKVRQKVKLRHASPDDRQRRIKRLLTWWMLRVWRYVREVNVALEIFCAVEAEIDLKRAPHLLEASAKVSIQLSFTCSRVLFQVFTVSAQVRSDILS